MAGIVQLLRDPTFVGESFLTKKPERDFISRLQKKNTICC